jgi:hypothetical protein
MKWPVFPSIPYKVTLIGKHKSCQIRTIAKDIVLVSKNIGFIQEIKKNYKQAIPSSWIIRLEYWKQNILAWILKFSSP